ncbi:SH3 domain-containing protein [Streptomyces sp. NPDC001544]|uniref:SH3 domain-containing protein n=1 Tax=Streptomyces sp. NPDC001544 TaxID=3364584 RepID=UPI0036A898A5
MSVVGIGEVEGVGGVEGVEGGDGSQTATATATEASAVHYYSVAPGVQLHVRSGPGTNYSLVRTLAEGAKVPIYCQTPGQTVTGPYGTSKIWDNIGDGQYVSDAYVHTGVNGYVTSRCS